MTVQYLISPLTPLLFFFLMASAEPVDFFWGPIDAMHQFCEAKYEVSRFFVEFWNATTNVPFFIVPGLVGLYKSRGAQDLRIQMLWTTMVVLGVGSFMFHATMRFSWEMLDE